MGTRGTDAATDLERLGRFFAGLVQSKAFAKVTVSVQKGEIGLVHVDRSYTPDQLPRTGDDT